MSARPVPRCAWFQATHLCHSVFSCFSPAAEFHCRLVASENCATLLPPVVVRISGSFPRFPISVTLFKLRLTTPPGCGSRGQSECSAREKRHQTVAGWSDPPHAGCGGPYPALRLTAPASSRSRPPPASCSTVSGFRPPRSRATRRACAPRRSTRGPRGRPTACRRMPRPGGCDRAAAARPPSFGARAPPRGSRSPTRPTRTTRRRSRGPRRRRRRPPRASPGRARAGRGIPPAPRGRRTTRARSRGCARGRAPPPVARPRRGAPGRKGSARRQRAAVRRLPLHLRLGQAAVIGLPRVERHGPPLEDAREEPRHAPRVRRRLEHLAWPDRARAEPGRGRARARAERERGRGALALGDAPEPLDLAHVAPGADLEERRVALAAHRIQEGEVAPRLEERAVSGHEEREGRDGEQLAAIPRHDALGDSAGDAERSEAPRARAADDACNVAHRAAGLAERARDGGHQPLLALAAHHGLALADQHVAAQHGDRPDGRRGVERQRDGRAGGAAGSIRRLLRPAPGTPRAHPLTPPRSGPPPAPRAPPPPRGPPGSVPGVGAASRAPSASPHACISVSVNSASGMAAARFVARSVQLRADVEQLVPQPRGGLEVERLRRLAHLLLEAGDESGEVARAVVCRGFGDPLLAPPRGAITLARPALVARVRPARDEAGPLHALPPP